MNDKNLKPFNTSASGVSKAAAAGRLGGIRSGETRRRRVMLREVLNDMLAMEPKDEEVLDALDSAGLPREHGFAIMLACIRRAEHGDVEAARFLRDTKGEKPSEQLNVQSSFLEQPIEALDLTKLSDDQLRALIADREQRIAAGEESILP